jgi:hypothetical protein
MARIYFHLKRLDGIIEDPEGAEFDDLSSAREEARHAAKGLIINMLEQDRPADVVAVRMTSEGGTLLDEIPLGSVIPEGLC